MTLAAQIQADTAGVFLNTADFAQLITYFPLGGRPVQFNAVDSQTGRREDEQTHHSLETDSVVLAVANDPAGLVGMANPQRGDAVLLANDSPDGRRPDGSSAYWSFKEIVDQDFAMFLVKFERPKLAKAGQIKPSQL